MVAELGGTGLESASTATFENVEESVDGLPTPPRTPPPEEANEPGTGIARPQARKRF